VGYPIGLGFDPRDVFQRHLVVLLLQPGSMDRLHSMGKTPARFNEQHAVSFAGFMAVSIFKTTAKTVVPSIKPNVGFTEHRCCEGQLGLHIWNELDQLSLLPRVLIVIQQAQYPIKRIAGNSVAVFGCQIQIFFL